MGGNITNAENNDSKKIEFYSKEEIERLPVEEIDQRVKELGARLSKIGKKIRGITNEIKKQEARDLAKAIQTRIEYLENTPQKKEAVKKAERTTKRKILLTIAAAIGVTLAFYGYQKVNREGGEGQDFLDSLKNRIENVLDTTETEENSKTLPDSAEVNAAKAKELQY